MNRRIADYSSASGFQPLNILATAGAGILALAVTVFLINFFVSMRKGEPAGDDPWGGYSLEWATTSPPPPHNVHRIPPVHSERPVFDDRANRGGAGAGGGPRGPGSG
jgi:heme/copper-type cytochrome/quinol oxidase subunit 1